MNSSKISARRYGRLLAVLSLRNQNMSSEEALLAPYYDKICEYFPKEMEQSLPVTVKKQIISFAKELLDGVESNHNNLIENISKVSKNRTWETFSILDQSLLLIGTLDLTINSSDPKIIIKEVLIISDMMNNQHAAPYLSGILKTMAYGDNIPPQQLKKPKLRLKREE